MQTGFSFPKSAKLRTSAEFQAVHAARVRVKRGGLVFVAMPNTLDHSRLGLSVGRSVGTAPRRNRIKRLLRESFRLTRHTFPRSLDLLILVRPHEPRTLAEYQAAMTSAANELADRWSQRD